LSLGSATHRRIRKTAEKITAIVKISAVVSGNVQKRIPHLSFRIILWASKKIGITTRPIRNTKTSMANPTLFRHLLSINGNSQRNMGLKTPLMPEGDCSLVATLSNFQLKPLMYSTARTINPIKKMAKDSHARGPVRN
ncbi:MAG: hypothetical protein KAI21_07515, partial [Deltaproteobacteria bacterium]|nr:hypothetical protein [Deltaproteobacteria bacterium]